MNQNRSKRPGRRTESALKTDRDDLLQLIALHRHGDYRDLAAKLTDLAYPGVGRMAPRLSPEKLTERFTERAETARMYDRCERGHSVRADLFGPNGECPECDATARREVRLRETAEWINGLPDEDCMKLMQFLAGFNLAA
jgi:hypothetical protein